MDAPEFGYFEDAAYYSLVTSFIDVDMDGSGYGAHIFWFSFLPDHFLHWLSLFFLSSSLFSIFCFWPTSGIPRKLIYYGPSYFDYKDYVKEKIIFKYLNYLFMEADLSFFPAFYRQCSVAAVWTNPSPWSIWYTILF